MSSEESKSEQETEMILEAVEIESSEDPPIEVWSSLVIKGPEVNVKRRMFAEGLYTPDSGNVCAKYISMSQSSVLRHPYYNYPAVTDPGILKALLKPEKVVIYPDDGQELYVALCEENKMAPVRSFLRGLLGENIDLSYYGVNPHAVRAMALALRYNKTVKVFNLTDNFLNEDSCYHLGDMLLTNTTMKELNLQGCRIGTDGARKLFISLVHNRGLITLNLSINQLGDGGMEILANAVSEGLEVRELYLSYNNISGKSLIAVSEAFEVHNKLTKIDLSWNNLFGVGANIFINALSESDILQDVNLAWNSLCGSRISLAIRNLVKAPMLRYLNLSNNKLCGEDINNIVGFLAKAKKLVTLDLSCNPLSTSDALKVINKMKLVAVKLQNLYMENVYIDVKGLKVINHIKQMKSKKNTVITYEGVVDTTPPEGADPRELVLNRAEFLCKKPKKNKFDIALIVLELEKRNIAKMSSKEFLETINATGAPLDDNLIEEFVNVFPGPKSAKMKNISVERLVEYVKRMWPDKKLPITPPPEPEPELSPAVDKGKSKKGKGKK